MKYLDVDWVLLGMRGWDIDETGAGLHGLPGGALPDGSSTGNHDVGDWEHAHLDRRTLHLILGGSAVFARRVLDDLQAAHVPGLIMTWVTTGSTDTFTEVRMVA